MLSQTPRPIKPVPRHQARPLPLHFHGANAKLSVSLGLYNGDGNDDKLVPTDNVTIPPNHVVPAVGEVCDVQYLHAFLQSGSIYQPIYLGKRCDIPAAECTTDQLKYKGTGEAAA